MVFPILGSHLDILRTAPRGELARHSENRGTPEFRQEIINLLHKTPLMNLTTCTPEGWPVGHCMHFATVTGTASRPILYSFTHESTRKLVNIPANPKVSGVLYDRESPFSRFIKYDGLARVIADEEEWDAANMAMYNKVGQQYTRLIRTEKQPALRIDIVDIEYFSSESAVPARLDFTDDILKNETQ